jgi:hypothetical protein
MIFDSKQQRTYWISGLLGGPGLAAILQRWVIKNPSEQLVGFIYLLGFIIYALVIIFDYKLREKRIEFLKHMVHTREEEQKSDGTRTIKDYGRIDSNSVEILEKIKNL